MADNTATWKIWPDVVESVISPNIYGHFAEHLGRCVYEGMWVGPDSAIPNERGFRLDTLRALRELRVPVVRWPGGCFADDYHWEDGVGPRESRHEWRNLWWRGAETNEFGTDEFLEFCRLIGAQPYICANVGTGTPTEASAWVEYCNGAGDTRYAKIRRKNGHAEPYGVRYWGVGNENWGCGGNFTAEEYAAAYRRFATYMRMVDPTVELIACGDNANGPQGPDWNQRFLAGLGLDRVPRLRRLIDHLSIHRYFRPLDDVAYSDEGYYEFLARSLVIEDDVRRTIDALAYYGSYGRAHAPASAAQTSGRIGIVVDEWGTWYSQASVEHRLEQQSTLLDAVVAAGTLDFFNRESDWVVMANIAQMVNVLQAVVQTEGERLWVTPTYHAFRLFAGHMGARRVRDELDTPNLSVAGASGMTALPIVSGSASLSDLGASITLTLTNRHLTETVECRVDLQGRFQATGGEQQVLGGDDVRAYNSADAPDRVRPTSRSLEVRGGELSVELPPHSVTAVTLRR